MGVLEDQQQNIPPGPIRYRGATDSDEATGQESCVKVRASSITNLSATAPPRPMFSLCSKSAVPVGITSSCSGARRALMVATFPVLLRTDWPESQFFTGTDPLCTLRHGAAAC